MVKDSAGKFDDYSISPKKKRQIVLHWGYELNKKRFAIILSH